jgi:hypothetical protein
MMAWRKSEKKIKIDLRCFRSFRCTRSARTTSQASFIQGEKKNPLLSGEWARGRGSALLLL